MITLIYRESAKGPLKYWRSDWKTKQACLKDARGNALRTIAILTDEEIEILGRLSYAECFLHKQAVAAEYCRDVLLPNKLRIDWANEQFQEEMDTLKRIHEKFKTEGKMTWEEYCFVKFGIWDIHTSDAYRIWGKDECQATASTYLYTEEDKAIDRDCGYTEDEINEKEAERGAEALINNELDNCADVNDGKDDMSFYFDWAYGRINKKFIKF